MTHRKPDPVPAPVSKDAPHPETSEHAPETSGHDEREAHNAPHSDQYDELAETTNDPRKRKQR